MLEMMLGAGVPLGDDLLFTGTAESDGRLRSLDPSSQQENWSIRPYTDRGVRAIAVSESGRVFASFDGNDSASSGAGTGGSTVVTYPPGGGAGEVVYQALIETSITGLDCDPSGDAIYLTHRGSNRAKQYVRKVRVSDGITLWSREPLLDTYNDYVFDLSLSPGGSHVYVLGAYIFKLDSSTGAIISKEYRGATANRYMRIVCGEEFVYSTTSSGVLAHNKTTLLQEHSYSLGSSCWGLSMSPDGDVIVTSQSGNIAKLTPSLGLVWQKTSSITPLTQAKVGKSGDVYVATGGNGSSFEGLVRVYDSDGNFKHYFAASNDQDVVSLGIYQPWLAA
ncbi:hypothetical protein HPA02_27140 [Bisbaumannia pacifica]|uniref:Uncharacterized protein n=1 Tax=Bisbaumannia pacifica TaxID=77098 RepID=A0A510XBM9_9GAMM|nr:hypothetical protein [Halomonas pacifica]GEK48431.1 hypothetical protein HPA02_27140 [Halomonas pacifica]